jgi:hypothetical protein
MRRRIPSAVGARLTARPATTGASLALALLGAALLAAGGVLAAYVTGTAALAIWGTDELAAHGLPGPASATGAADDHR